MRINRKLLKIAILPLICGLTFVIFLFSGGLVARNTQNEGKNIRQILEDNPRGQVLGEVETKNKSNNNSKVQIDKIQPKIQPNECPKNLPIIAWIDYSGQKTIKKELPVGQKPTICFENLEIAKNEGYK